jgi:hypothetical protein
LILLSDLITGPGLRVLDHLAGPTDDAEVRNVMLVEDPDKADLPSDAVIVLTRSASVAATGYRLDMVLRVAAAHRAAAIVLTDGRERIQATAVTIAERSDVTVLSAHENSDIGELLLALYRGVAGGAETALFRLQAAQAALADTEAGASDTTEIMDAVTHAFGQPFDLRTPNEGEIAERVIVLQEEDAVCTEACGGHAEMAARAVAQLTAAAISRVRAAQRRAEDIPIRSRGELLTEFLLAPPARGDRLLDRMRAIDLAVDGWHAVIRVEVENLDVRTDGDELTSYNFTTRLARAGLEAARASGGIWHAAQLGSALMLIRMERRDFGAHGARDTARAAQDVIRRVTSRDDTELVCGIGGVYSGVTGLRASAAEAQAAVTAARAAHRTNTPVSFDKAGLRRTLLEWFSTDTAREAVDSILQPLDRLGADKRKSSIETLQAYLDNQGSLVQTGKQLHLHRNAVGYRIKRIFEMLEVEFDDADTRLLLQLACRARSLS